MAATVREARIPLKLCDTAETLRPLLPSCWTIGAPCYVMTIDAKRPAMAALPDGYRADLGRRGALSTVRIVAPDGALAASGHAALWNGFRVFDRIVTQEAHRRRGLGRTTMALLAADTIDEGAQSVLVATEAGAALYATLGWTIRSPYTTAVIEPR